MQRISRHILLAVLLGIPSVGMAGASANTLIESRAIAEQLEQRLQRDLKERLESASGQGALARCHQITQAILEQMSADTGFTIKRISLYAQHPQTQPERWEKVVLETFNAQLKAGDALEKLEFYERHQHKTTTEFHYMRALQPAGVCAHCHQSPQGAVVGALSVVKIVPLR
ncbi:c-type heme family protein [Thiorhodospira sibirica]|uniref:c-type heme family protein n=1 Tax=Thiorhodospira sibirica TaxID=154347 RepID=UPI00022C0AD0|nr:DUF3365 domain-containing protein [Thiorhodospira sibirica]